MARPEPGHLDQALRGDRILHEIQATNGDVRRVCDLFGLSIAGATRYADTLEHPGFESLDRTNNELD